MRTMSRVFFVLVVLFFTLFSTNATRAQFTQQGDKLVGTGAVGAYVNQGSSVALSADGNTVIVGGPGDSSQAGAAWAFTRSGSVWTQQGSKLVGTGAVGRAYQSQSVSLSSDGNTAIVGGGSDNGGTGAAWIFTRSEGTWNQQGSKLVGAGAAGQSYQGTSVSISADGNTAIVGGWADDTGVGATWVFTRSGSAWTQEGSKLVGTGAVGNATQGTSVSLSADGNTAIVGGPYDSSRAGAVWAFTRSGGVWMQQGNKLIGTGAVGNAYQGRSVSLSSDGNTAIVGGNFDNGSIGAAWVFVRSSGVWIQQGNKLVGAGAVGQSYQGTSVSISGDGNTAIVGGFQDNNGVGAAWVFARNGSVWTQQGNKLVGTGAVGSAYQGTDVSISSDGNTAIEGGYNDNGGAGAAWVFTRGSSSAGEPNVDVPRQFTLQQNHPNPFNPGTTIEYSIPQLSTVEIKVLDVLGREVVTLLSEEKPAGAYTVRWNADGVASGVYFYRLQAGGLVQARKMLLVR